MAVMNFLAALAQAIATDGLTLFVLIVITILGARRGWVLGRELRYVEKQLTDERIDFMRQLSELREEKNAWRAAALLHSGHAPPEAGHPHESRQAPDPAEGD